MAFPYGAAQRMRPSIASPTQIAYWRDWHLSGEEGLSVTAWDVPGGANVLVEACVKAITEWSADPGSILGFVPRQDMWFIASELVARLGVNPDAVFRHI